MQSTHKPLENLSGMFRPYNLHTMGEVAVVVQTVRPDLEYVKYVMRRLFLITAILLSGCTSGPAPQPVENAPAPLPDLTPVSVAPPTVDWRSFNDFTGLREAYARREDFFKRCEEHRPDEAFTAKIKAHDFSGAADVTRRFLQQCPVDAEAHLWLASALYKLGHPAEAKLHLKWFRGLTDSAMSTGDGKKPETAYVTISVAEEYAILARLRERPVSQALIESPTAVDAITVKDEQGRESTIYFNPSWHFVRLAHMLQKLNRSGRQP